MSFTFIQKIIILLGLCFSSALALAHQPRFTIDMVGQESHVDANELTELIHRSHEVIEGEHEAGFWQRWRQSFDFKSRLIDSIRVADAAGTSDHKDVAIDSVLLFGLSHGLEMMTGPALVALGAAQGWPDWLLGAIAGSGTLMSIPGLDPLCMLIFATYAKSKSFRSGFATVRQGIFRFVSKAWQKTSISETLARFFQRVDLRQYMENLSGLKSVTSDEDDSTDFIYESDDGSLRLTLHFHDDEGFVESIGVRSGLQASSKKSLSSYMRQFGWNAREFVNRIFKNRRANFESPFVVSSQAEGEWTTYQLLPRAIRVKAPFKNCESWLRL